MMTALFDDITSRDTKRVWASACAIIKLRADSELRMLALNLDEIRSKTEDLALGGAVFPNAEHLKFALRKLEYFRDGQGCLCNLYPEYLMFDPEREQAAGNVRILETIHIDGKWVDYYKCACTKCGAAFKVEEREYHYTWWGWILLARPSTPAAHSAGEL